MHIPNFALCDCKNEGKTTDNVFPPYPRLAMGQCPFRFGGRKNIKNVKFQITTNCRNPQFHFLFLPFNISYRLFSWYLHDISMIYMVFTLFILCYLYFVQAELIICQKIIQIWQKIRKSWIPQNLWNPFFASLLSETYYKFAQSP